MRYSLLSAAVAALVSSVSAQTAGFDAITSPTQDQNIEAGSSFDIIWEPAGVTGTVTLGLLQGATPSTLENGPIIAASIDNTLGKYTYTAPSSGSFATYGIAIVLDSSVNNDTPTFQYSKPFHIVGGSSSSSASGSTSSSTTSSTSESSSVATSPTNKQNSPAQSSSASSAVVTSSTSATSAPSSTTVSDSSATGLASDSSSSGSSSKTTTLQTTITKDPDTVSTSSTSSPTSSKPATVTANAGMSNVARGGVAMMGGLVLALAL